LPPPLNPPLLRDVTPGVKNVDWLNEGAAVIPHRRPPTGRSSTVMTAEHDASDLTHDSLRYVEPVQLGVQQPRQTPVELVGIPVRTRAAAFSIL